MYWRAFSDLSLPLEIIVISMIMKATASLKLTSNAETKANTSPDRILAGVSKQSVGKSTYVVFGV